MSKFWRVVAIVAFIAAVIIISNQIEPQMQARTVATKCGRDAKCVDAVAVEPTSKPAPPAEPADGLSAKHVFVALTESGVVTGSVSGGTEQQKTRCAALGCLGMIEAETVTIYEWPEESTAVQAEQIGASDYQKGRFSLVFHVRRDENGAVLLAPTPNEQAYRDALDRVVAAN